ncbi:MAG TPA: endonuclease/exonuclease/phosphatase family protein [Allosphingosinicella sp.]
MKNLLKSLAAVIALFFAVAAEAQTIPQGSLRIGTYNSYLLSPAFKCLAIFGEVPPVECLAQIGGQTEEWANRLADAIIADSAQLDVVVLNEVWDEDAKNILVSRLSFLYPVYIKKVDVSLINVRANILADIPNEFHAALGFRFNGEDSGLMLFAKRGFRPLPLPSQAFHWSAHAGQSVEGSTDRVAFTYFEDCESDDCFAAKGAAMIRLQHGRRGPIYNVVLTHMQADYPEDGERYPGVRRRQLARIRDMVEQTLAPLDEHLQGREMVLLLGDLNVPYLKDRDEWNARFGSGFFRSPLFEAWHYTSSRKDLQPTNYTDEERLDYILASPRTQTRDEPTPRLFCVQHMTVPLRFRALDSDHKMVHADINYGYDHCSPAIAYEIAPPGPGEARDIGQSPSNPARDVTRIYRPGAMQWFFVKNDGTNTYSIGLDNDDLRLDVFRTDDLTVPVSRYNKTAATMPPAAILQVYAMNQFVVTGDFYLRVRGKDRTTVGDYALRVRRHSCASRQDACLLEPGTLQQAVLSEADIPANLARQNEAWFRFDVVGASSFGKPQTLTFTASLFDQDRVSAAFDSYSDPLGGPLPQMSSMTNIVSFTGKIGDGGRGYLVLKQSEPGPDPTPVMVTLDTNMRYLDVGQLVCRDETNPELGSDEIYTTFRIDGTARRAPGSGYVSFDCDGNWMSKNWAPRLNMSTIRFVDDLTVRIREEDDTSGDDPSQLGSVSGFPPGGTELDTSMHWKFEGGEYEFRYRLRRRPNAPVADPQS